MVERDGLMEQVRVAVLRRACAVFGLENVDLAAATTSGSMFDPAGFSLGGYVFDSMDLVELLMTVGDELRVPLLDLADEHQADTIDDVLALAVARAGPAIVAGFVAQWNPGAATTTGPERR